MSERYQDGFDNIAMNVRQAKIPALIAIGELFMIQTQTMQNSRVLIMDMNRIGHVCVGVGNLRNGLELGMFSSNTGTSMLLKKAYNP